MVFALTLAAVAGRPEPRQLKTPTEEFADFKAKFGKAYRDIREEASRFQIFQVYSVRLSGRRNLRDKPMRFFYLNFLRIVSRVGIGQSSYIDYFNISELADIFKFRRTPPALHFESLLVEIKGSEKRLVECCISQWYCSNVVVLASTLYLYFRSVQ